MSNAASFIHSSLDDYGLTPQQFRVFCHVSRRSNGDVCYSSLRNMAEVCRMDIKTVRVSLSFLVEQSIIADQRRAGQSSLLKINPVADWKPLPKDTTPKPHHTQKTPQGVGSFGSTPLPKDTTKGNPLKVIPKRFSQAAAVLEIPAALNHSEFKAVWSEWQEYRLGLKSKPKNPTKMLTEQLRFLAQHSADAVEILRASMRNGWQGLFPLKAGSQPRNGQPI